jgi:hypothetical protein
MAHMTLITVQDLDPHDFDREDDMALYAVEHVGAFAAGVHADVDVSLHSINFWNGWAVVEVTGTVEDAGLVARRWDEE